ncbi:MAG: hypothetical protein ABII90_13845 [Bacteroidota bacterium]
MSFKKLQFFKSRPPSIACTVVCSLGIHRPLISNYGIKITISALYFIILSCLLLLPSCKKDNDDDTTATRDDYIGLWLCEEFDQNMILTYTFQVEIIKHQTNSTKVWIDNFNQLGIGFQAEAIIDNTSIIIPQQIVGNGFNVSGSGFITNKHTTIEFQYFVNYENITATYTKF